MRSCSTRASTRCWRSLRRPRTARPTIRSNWTRARRNSSRAFVARSPKIFDFFIRAPFQTAFLSHPTVRIRGMEFALLDEAIESLEKCNADLEPELMSAEMAREALTRYAKIKKLGSYGETLLSRKVDDAT